MGNGGVGESSVNESLGIKGKGTISKVNTSDGAITITTFYQMSKRGLYFMTIVFGDPPSIQMDRMKMLVASVAIQKG